MWEFSVVSLQIFCTFKIVTEEKVLKKQGRAPCLQRGQVHGLQRSASSWGHSPWVKPGRVLWPHPHLAVSSLSRSLPAFTGASWNALCAPRFLPQALSFENIFVCPHSWETFMFHTSSLMGASVSLSTLLLVFHCFLVSITAVEKLVSVLLL